jgi:hypothetical protein
VHLSYQHKSIIVGGRIRSCFQAIRTSTYESNYIVCFKFFLIVGVRYISYGSFQTKVYKLVAVIVYERLKRKVGSLWKLSWFNIIEVSVLCTDEVNSSFHLYGCGKPPQPYRWCPFGCRYSGRSWWGCRRAFGILWPKLATMVVIEGLWVSSVL